MATIKNPAQWTPPSGTGFVLSQGNLLLIDNTGKFLIDNLANKIVTTPTYNVPRYPTTWTGSGA